jgi:hypothetical protein
MPSPVDLRGVARAAAAESAERFHAAGAAIQQHAAKRQQHAASSGLHLAHRISQLCSARLVAVSKHGPCVSVLGAGALSAANYSECSVPPWQLRRTAMRNRSSIVPLTVFACEVSIQAVSAELHRQPFLKSPLTVT